MKVLLRGSEVSISATGDARGCVFLTVGGTTVAATEAAPHAAEGLANLEVGVPRMIPLSPSACTSGRLLALRDKAGTVTLYPGPEHAACEGVPFLETDDPRGLATLILDAAELAGEPNLRSGTYFAARDMREKLGL